MHSKEFKKIYHPKLGRYVYEHRGNGLIVDNLMKPLKTVGRTLKRATKFAKVVHSPPPISMSTPQISMPTPRISSEKAGDLIRKRLNGQMPPKTSKTLKTSMTKAPKRKGKRTKTAQQDVNTLINNIIARS